MTMKYNSFNIHGNDISIVDKFKNSQIYTFCLVKYSTCNCVSGTQNEIF